MNRRSWKSRAKRFVLVGAGGCVMQLSMCTSDAGVKFRAAAGDSIKTGVLSILNGAVEGAFAIVDPGTTSSQ